MYFMSQIPTENSLCWYKRSTHDRSILINCEVATYGINRYRNENRLSDMYYKLKSCHKPDESIVRDVNEYFRIPMQKYTIYIKICTHDSIHVHSVLYTAHAVYILWYYIYNGIVDAVTRLTTPFLWNREIRTSPQFV